MLDVGWTEMLVIAVVMIVVVGPKDLPNMLRTMGRMTAKLRGMAGDFQRQFNEALKEAELDDVKKSVDSLRSLNPMTEIRKQLNPFEQAASDVRSGLDDAVKPKPAAPDTPPAEGQGAQPSEPLKNGATAMPGPDDAATAQASAPAATASDSVAVAVAVAAPAAGKGEAAPAKPASVSAQPKPKAKPAAVKRAAAKPASAAPSATKPAPAKPSTGKGPAKPARAASASAASKTTAKPAARAKQASAGPVKGAKAPAAGATGKRTAK